MPSAVEWKRLYARERESLGEAGLQSLVRAAPENLVAASHAVLDGGGGVVFPHVFLSGCGAQVAAVARALVDRGTRTVLALGVLHGARERDSDVVRRARAGSARATEELRRVHGPGAPGDDGRADEEFSLDNFEALLGAAAALAGQEAPRLVRRFPFLVSTSVEDLPGLDELEEIADGGAALVATADHLHHGVGYGTAEERRLASDDPAARRHARAVIDASCDLLARGNLAGFQRLAAEENSDFRDAGPVLGHLLSRRGSWTASVAALDLVSYAETLKQPEPTWVAAALLACRVTPREIEPRPRATSRGCG